MIHIAQHSKDGKEWIELPQAVIFRWNSRKEALAWFDDVCKSNKLDWRVGFLARMASGDWYRVVNKRGDVAK